MEKIFQETRVSTNHPSNNPRKVRLRKGAEILVLFPRLCTMQDLSTRHDWPDKKNPLSICQSGWRKIRNTLPVIRWVRWGPSLKRRIGAAFQTLLTGVTLGLRRRLICWYINVKTLLHKILVFFLFFFFFFLQHAEKPISKANSWGGYGRLSLTVFLPTAVSNCDLNTVFLFVCLFVLMPLSFVILDTSIHCVKWWWKCWHYIHVGVSSARTEKIPWPKLGLANFRIILNTSAFLLLNFFSQMHRWSLMQDEVETLTNRTCWGVSTQIPEVRNLLFIGTFFLYLLFYLVLKNSPFSSECVKYFNSRILQGFFVYKLFFGPSNPFPPCK